MKPCDTTLAGMVVLPSCSHIPLSSIFSPPPQEGSNFVGCMSGKFVYRRATCYYLQHGMTKEDREG